MRGGGEGSVGLIGAGTSNWLKGRFYNVEMQRETPERQGLRNLQLDMTGGFAKRFALGRALETGCRTMSDSRLRSPGGQPGRRSSN